MRSLWAVALVCGCAVAASGRDWTLDWKHQFILQPELRVDDTGPPEFLWRRVRFVWGGPISAQLKAKVQVDGTKNGLDFLDLFADWTPLQDPVRVNVKGGLFYPSWAHEGQTLPNTILYSTIITATGQQQRNVGGQVSVGFGGLYQAVFGVFNGVQSFDDPNGRPNYLAGLELVPPWFDARIWYLTGNDGNGVTNTPTELYSAEITEANFGRFGAEAMVCAGRRFGKRVEGGYVQGLYRIGRSNELYLKWDFADIDVNAAGGWRQRYVASLHHRWESWLTTFGDVEYDTVTGRWRLLLQGDVRF